MTIHNIYITIYHIIIIQEYTQLCAANASGQREGLHLLPVLSSHLSLSLSLSSVSVQFQKNCKASWDPPKPPTKREKGDTFKVRILRSLRISIGLCTVL